MLSHKEGTQQPCLGVMRKTACVSQTEQRALNYICRQLDCGKSGGLRIRHIMSNDAMLLFRRMSPVFYRRKRPCPYWRSKKAPARTGPLAKRLPAELRLLIWQLRAFNPASIWRIQAASDSGRVLRQCPRQNRRSDLSSASTSKSVA